MSGRFDSCTAMRRLLGENFGLLFNNTDRQLCVIKKIPDLTILPRNNRSGPALLLSMLL
jgi:hypothetical protein